MKKNILSLTAIVACIALASCGGKKSAASVAKQWCDMNAKVTKAAEGPDKEAAREALHKWEKETEANGRRIVAAVNACEGLSTEALELGIVRELRDALQAASDWIDTQTLVPRADIQARLQATIAKATSDRRPA